MVELSVGAVPRRASWGGSTCEVEYIAASEAANEGVWMKEFISDLGVIVGVKTGESRVGGPELCV